MAHNGPYALVASWTNLAGHAINEHRDQLVFDFLYPNQADFIADLFVEVTGLKEESDKQLFRNYLRGGKKDFRDE